MSDDEMPGAVDLACIAYEGDARLMVLQMLSVDRLLDLDGVGSYVVILNGADNAALEAFMRGEVFSRVSPELRDRVVFVDGPAILGAASTGWRDQQALKLLISKQLTGDHYLLLDAKNHFIRPTVMGDFFQGGVPKTVIKPMAEGWIQHMRASLRPFGALTEENLVTMPPSITPYMMIRKEVLSLIERVEASASKGFVEAFEDLPKATEFFLYYAHFISGSVRFPYVDAPALGTTLYTVWPQDPEKVLALIDEAADKDHALFGLHRKRLPQLTEEQSLRIVSLWRRHLLKDWEDASWFMVHQEASAAA